MTSYITKVLVATIVTFALLAISLPVEAQTSPGSPTIKPTPRRTTRRPARLVPVGTNLKIRLEDTLSSKDSRVGDKFTATVLEPDRFDEATVHGHVSSIQKSGKVKGRTTMNLAFDSIHLRDGRRGTLHGYVTRVYGNDSGTADEEGGVESEGRGKQTIKRGAIGGAAGAIIGAIAGGGKGAAIGLIVGGAAGAGSLAIGGSKELKLESGTELLIRVTR